jgi:hypothetical protein
MIGHVLFSGLSSLPLSTILLLDFGTVPTLWYFTFLFYYYFICISNIEQLINTSISFIRKQIQTMREIKSANAQIVIIYDISTIKLISF